MLKPGLVTLPAAHVRQVTHRRHMLVDSVDTLFQADTRREDGTHGRRPVVGIGDKIVVVELAQHVSAGVELDSVATAKVGQDAEYLVGVAALPGLPEKTLNGVLLLHLENVVYVRLASGLEPGPSKPVVRDVEETVHEGDALRIAGERLGHAVVPEGASVEIFDGVLALGNLVGQRSGLFLADAAPGDAGASHAIRVLHVSDTLAPVAREKLPSNPRLDAVERHFSTTLESHSPQKFGRRLGRVAYQAPRCLLYALRRGNPGLDTLDDLVPLLRLGGADGGDTAGLDPLDNQPDALVEKRVEGKAVSELGDAL